jgi:hypothetical protein
MKVLDLCCSNEHQFEGWFASEEDFQSQRARLLIECPMCGDTAVLKRPSATRFSVSNVRSSPSSEPSSSAASESDSSETATTSAAAPDLGALQAKWLRVVRYVMTHTVDMGTQFAEEARRIHYGESEQRPIRGQISHHDAQALIEEGIDIMPLLVPAALKGEVQ